MLIRIRSKEGTSRIEVQPNDDAAVLSGELEKVLKSPVDADATTISDKPAGGERTLSSLHGQSVGELGLKHGDMLFVKLVTSTSKTSPTTSTAPQSTTSRLNGKEVAAAEMPSVAIGGDETKHLKNAFESVKQDHIDDVLEKMDGKIYRKQGRMCRHGPQGMCDYCMPLEPYDAKYLEEHKIKHQSFHAYLRKLNTATNKPEMGASYVPPLSEPEYRVKSHCPSGHPPWPKGICSKCQPGAISLQLQQFRMVDHVEFASSELVNGFIEFWRKSGTQRFGYLYGRYERYDQVPLGMKAVVEAIYEPPQGGETDGLALAEWENEHGINEVAGGCGLRMVGMIFTDLVDDGMGKGTVIPKRHAGSYFLSALEIHMAATMQNRHKNTSKWSETGEFGSKFVTCVISGNDEGQIDIAAYQASNSAMAMVKADVIEPSVDPGIMLVKHEDETRYIPDVFYRKVNEYGRAVQIDAKPAFPVEYLLVTLTHGFPENPKPMFLSHRFPVENRQVIGVVQDLAAVGTQVGVRRSGKSAETGIDAVSDFHMLCFLHGMGILEEEDEKALAKVACGHEIVDAYALLERPGWQTLLTIIREST